jgi:predicted helicase
MRRIYKGDAGTPENSYVPNLVDLLKSVLTEVEVVPWPKGNTEGLPDIGISVSNIIEGYVEAEALAKPLEKNAHGQKQALGYSKEAPTLLTNFHQFWIIDQGQEVQRYGFSKDELLTKPIADVVAAHEEKLKELLYLWANLRTPITDPEALAERLSEYARNALGRLEEAPTVNLTPLRKAMEEALGVKVKDKEGEHFFRSSVVQALFYGLFSAWVEAAKQGKGQRLELYEASSYLRVPLVVSLFEQITTPSQIKDLGLKVPITWALDALRRVEPEPFLKAFEEGQAVQYFYEPFLEKFDSKLRKDLGVWYTPREIVRYQVEKTHELLQTELGIEKGLLDERVVMLDPATGTGSYLVEIGRFLLEKLAGNSLSAQIVKEAFKTRIYGFELLPAPFIIAHLQLGLLLADAGAPLEESERVGVYLTNSLLGWKKDAKEDVTPIWPQFAKEKEAADRVKREEQILVFIGNPPYDRFTVVAKDEQADLIAPYKECLYESWGVKKQTLDDLYIRFIRLAERQIAETQTAEGVVSYITNRSYLTGLSHPVMRQHLIENFHSIYIDDLHGTQRANRPNDGSVFTTDTASGVRVGVAVTHLVRKKEPAEGSANVYYREYREGTGKAKRAALVTQAQPFGDFFEPERQHRYLLRPLVGEDAYWTWPNLPEIFPTYFSGVQASRDLGPMKFESEKAELEQQMRDYYNSSISSEELRKRYPALMNNASSYDAIKTRELLLKKSRLYKDRVMQYLYRPFDRRWLYWEEHGKILVRNRPEFFEQIFDKQRFLIAAQTMRRGYDPPQFSRALVEFHVIDPDARAFPLKLRYHPVSSGQGKLFESGDDWQYLPNVADFYDDLVKQELLKLPKKKSGCEPMPKPTPVLLQYGQVRDADGKPTKEAFILTEALFYHALAIMHAPVYREDHAEYLAEDWPRIPLPETKEKLMAGGALGKKVATLLDPLSDASALLKDYSSLGQFTGNLKQLKIEKSEWKNEALHLSSTLRLENVPEAVWNYTLGGYPVLSKWLDYRKGRVLNLQEAQWLSAIVQRIAALLAMDTELDTHYRSVT